MFYYDGMKIRDELARQGLTVRRFAKEAQISPTTAQSALAGGKALRPTMLGKIARALNIDPPSSLLRTASAQKGGD